jgi:hypothetical protein
MAGKIGYALVSVLLVGYFVLAGHRGVVLIGQGTWVTVPFGIAVLVMPLIGAWFLWRTTRFARDAGKLAKELEAEGGLPVDDLPRTPSGRVEQGAADAAFAERQAEAEENPRDWRCWFRLALAYHDARDTPRARKAMEHAIALRAGRA